MGSAASTDGPGGRRWEITFTAEAQRWYDGLTDGDTERISGAIDRLARLGPAMGRPRADSIAHSRHHNMKELRSSGGHLRVLFAFDRQRRAVLLVGGDKAGNWKGWYQRSIPRAERLYEQHLRDNGGEVSRWGPDRRGAGRPSGRGER